MTPKLLCLTLAAVLAPLPLLAQEPIIEQQSGPDILYGGHILVGVPVGEFDRHVGAGLGLAGHGVLAIPDAPIGLRVQGSWLVYGSETYSAPLIGHVWADVTTENWISSLGVGPQLMARSGALRPYVHAVAGFSYFSTTSEVRGQDDFYGFARSTDFDDFTFSWGFGGGFQLSLSDSLSLDVGVRYLDNGRVRYLTEGDIYEDDFGDVFLTPRRSEANLVEVVLGVSFGR